MMDKSKHIKLTFCKRKNLSNHVSSPFLKKFDELNEQIFEVEKQHKKIVHDLPAQIGQQCIRTPNSGFLNSGSLSKGFGKRPISADGDGYRFAVHRICAGHDRRPSNLNLEKSGVRKNGIYFHLISNLKSFLEDRKSRYHNGIKVLQVSLNRNLLGV